MKLSNKKGFTMIEAMIIVAILGILSAVIVPYVSSLFTAAKWNKKHRAEANITAYEARVLMGAGWSADKIQKTGRSDIDAKLRTIPGGGKDTTWGPSDDTESSACNCAELYKEIYELRKQLGNN